MQEQERLIDATALKKRAVRMSTVKDIPHVFLKAVGTREIDKAPTIDAVRVVRCKNCVKRGTGDCPKERDFPWIESDSNGFCDEGEEKG